TVLLPAAAVLGGLLLAVVSLNVVLASSSLRIDAAQQRLRDLGAEQRELLRTQAALSSPERIAAWAESHGMRMAEDVRILGAAGNAAG
ncbi:MAG: hypothetical protein ACKO8G_07435, partial [Actinomycetota bacterium]